MDLFGRKAKTERNQLAITAYKLVRDLRAANKAYEAEIVRLRGKIDLLQTQVEEVKTKPPIKSQSLYLNETEEDIEYAFKNELIDRAEYEDMLRQLEFDNSNITFDLEPI